MRSMSSALASTSSKSLPLSLLASLARGDCAGAASAPSTSMLASGGGQLDVRR